jgi:hypothetical protein
LTLYILRDLLGESIVVPVCEAHASEMPAVGGRVTAEPCDDDIPCDFCRQEAPDDP